MNQVGVFFFRTLVKEVRADWPADEHERSDRSGVMNGGTIPESALKGRSVSIETGYVLRNSWAGDHLPFKA